MTKKARVRGTVRFFDGRRGFGFIKIDDGGDKEAFFSARSIPRGAKIGRGIRVEFDCIHAPEGLRAVGVKVFG